MNLLIQSKRLTLTPFDISDVDLAIKMFTDPEVSKYTGGAMEECEIRSEMLNWIKRGSNGVIGIWCISDRCSGEKLGTVALLPMPVEKDNTDFSLVKRGQMPDGDVEIGYFLKRTAWGKGYATEACKRLLQAAFEESPLTGIVATFDKGNSASRHVLKKAGFVDRGTKLSYGSEGPYYRIDRYDWI